MKQIITYLMIAMIFFVSCKKESSGLNQGTATFTINGKSYTTDNNWMQYDFYSQKLYNSTFMFHTGYTYIQFQFGYPFQTQTFKTLYSTDSLISGNSYATLGAYSAQYQTDGTTVYNYTTASSNPNYFRFQVSVSNVSNGLVSGTFSGRVSGTIAQTGSAFNDSIMNGSFQNIPILRQYH